MEMVPKCGFGPDSSSSTSSVDHGARIFTVKFFISISMLSNLLHLGLRPPPSPLSFSSSSISFSCYLVNFFICWSNHRSWAASPPRISCWGPNLATPGFFCRSWSPFIGICEWGSLNGHIYGTLAMPSTLSSFSTFLFIIFLVIHSLHHLHLQLHIQSIVKVTFPRHWNWQTYFCR